jgi:hypothetical protein
MTSVTGLISTHSSFLFLSHVHQHTPHNYPSSNKVICRVPHCHKAESHSSVRSLSIILPSKQNPEVSQKNASKYFHWVCDIRVPLMNFKLV